MAICVNQGRMYMGTARQYMDRPCGCQQAKMEKQSHMIRKIDVCDSEHQRSCECENERTVQCHEDGCQPESMCYDLPLAMAYMNPQPYTGLVNGDIALTRGSAFNNLYDPWMGRKKC